MVLFPQTELVQHQMVLLPQTELVQHQMVLFPQTELVQHQMVVIASDISLIFVSIFVSDVPPLTKRASSLHPPSPVAAGKKREV